MRASFERKIALAAATLALGGCLVSEAPLLDDRTARAKPLKPGLYDVCESESGAGAECNPLRVEREGVLYRFAPPDDDEPSLARFRSIGGGAFLAQMWGSGAEGAYFYFYAEKTRDGLMMAMIDCGALPDALRAELAATGDIAVEDGGASCAALTLAGAEGAARAYKGEDGVVPDERLDFRRVGD